MEKIRSARAETKSATRLLNFTSGPALKIALWFAVFGSLWIYGSGWLLHYLVQDPELSAILEEIKGWFFVGVTALLLGLALSRYFSRIQWATQALSESSARLRTAMESMTDAVFISDSDGRFIEFNEAFAAFHKFKSKLECAKTLQEHPDILEVFTSDGKLAPMEQWSVPRALRGEIATNEEYGLRRKDTGETWIGSYSFAPIRDRDHSIVGSVVVGRDITAQKQAEKDLRNSEERFHTLVDSAPDGIFVQSGGLVLYLNPAMCRIMGAESAEELVGKDFTKWIAPGYLKLVSERIRFQDETGKAVPPMEMEYVRLNGSRILVETTAVPIHFQGHDAHLIFVRDSTARLNAEAERQSLQAQLQQAQKMESVGRLAGGVAHDYNNMLSVIIGYSELALGKLKSEDEIRDDLKEILKAARRSTGITRQLLAFARRQTINPKVLDLNETVEGMLKMLRRLIGEDIDLTWKPRAGLWNVKMDPSQVDQILANLCVNARDAIADVGRITIETGMATFDEAYCITHTGTTPGDFVWISVSDNGCGMDDETLDKIFEPFFTTKGVGHGTGLGLATVYGIVKQNNGCIDVFSRPSEGSVFKIFLPGYKEDVTENEKEREDEAPKGAGETVLVVEDEFSILKMVETILTNYNYKVLAAQNPFQALELASGNAGEIALLITDVVMPDMNGRELADQLKSFSPQSRCLYMSGYTADVIAHRGILDKNFNFIQKPFTPRELAIKTRAVLDDMDKI